MTVLLLLPLFIIVNVSGQSVKRSLATRLAFDETIDEPILSSRKVSRLDGADPFSSQSGMRRFPSENLDTVTSLQREVSQLKHKTSDLEAALAGCRAQVAGTESKVNILELERDRLAVEWDRERAAVEREREEARDKYESLKCRLKQHKQRESDKLEDGSRARQLWLDKSADLENKVSLLRTEKDELEQKLLQANIALDRRPDVDKLRYNEEIQQFKSRVSDLENKESVYETEVERMEQKKKQTEELLIQNEKLQGQLRMEKLRADKLEGELEANKDAVLQRMVMRDKLEKYHELEAENFSLRSRNKLLVETAENR